jgi:hypothetical protein
LRCAKATTAKAQHAATAAAKAVSKRRRMAIRYPAPPQVIQETAVDADVEGTREH